MTHDTPDPYAVLGVSPTATPRQVAAAHRRLAKRYHPDLNPGPAAAERMQRINRAWQVLSNPVRRARYDAGRRGAATTHVRWSSGDWGGYAASSPYAAQGYPRTRRPPRPDPVEPSFGDQPWVAGVAWAMLALLLFVGTYLGSLPR